MDTGLLLLTVTVPGCLLQGRKSVVGGESCSHHGGQDAERTKWGAEEGDAFFPRLTYSDQVPLPRSTLSY